MKKIFWLSLFFGIFSSTQAYWVGENFEKNSQKTAVKINANTVKITQTVEIKNTAKNNNSAQWIEIGDQISDQKMFVDLAGLPIEKISNKNKKVSTLWKIAKNFEQSTVFKFFNPTKDLLASNVIQFLPEQTKTIKTEWTTNIKNISNIAQLSLNDQNNWHTKYEKLHVQFVQNPKIFYHFLKDPNQIFRESELHAQWEWTDKTNAANTTFLWSQQNTATAKWINPYGEFSAEFNAYPAVVDHQKISIFLDTSGSMSDGKWEKVKKILPEILAKFPKSQFQIGTISNKFEWWNENFLPQNETLTKIIYDETLHLSPLGKFDASLFPDTESDLNIFITDEPNFNNTTEKNWLILYLGLENFSLDSEFARGLTLFPYEPEFVKKDLFSKVWYLFRKTLNLPTEDANIFPKKYEKFELDKNPVFWKRNESKTAGFEPNDFEWTMPFWAAKRLDVLISESQPARHRNTDLLSAMLSIGKNFGVENFFFNAHTSQNELQKFLWKIPETQITQERKKLAAQTQFFTNSNLKFANGRLARLEDKETVWRLFDWWDKARTPFIDEIAPFSDAQKNLFEFWPEKFSAYFALGNSAEFCIAQKCFRITEAGETEKNDAHKMRLKNIPTAHWSDEFVYKVAKKKATKISSNGSVNIDKKLTRAEFANLAAQYFELELIETDQLADEKKFPDVNINQASSAAIYTLADQEILNGYRDGKFYPNKAISRAEALKITFSLKKLAPYGWDGTQEIFADTNGWEKPWANFAHRKNIINGIEKDGQKKFLPNQTISLSEAAKIVVKIFEL